MKPWIDLLLRLIGHLMGTNVTRSYTKDLDPLRQPYVLRCLGAKFRESRLAEGVTHPARNAVLLQTHHAADLRIPAAIAHTKDVVTLFQQIACVLGIKGSKFRHGEGDAHLPRLSGL